MVKHSCTPLSIKAFCFKGIKLPILESQDNNLCLLLTILSRENEVPFDSDIFVLPAKQIKTSLKRG